jgi:hypothetical protein
MGRHTGGVELTQSKILSSSNTPDAFIGGVHTPRLQDYIARVRSGCSLEHRGFLRRTVLGHEGNSELYR